MRAGRAYYLTIRRFVDADLRTRLRPLSLAILAVPLMVTSFMQRGLDAPIDKLWWAVAGGTSFAWFVFCTWRAYRLLKATAIRGDRAFDRCGKHALAQEYHESESATAARRRRKAAR